MTNNLKPSVLLIGRGSMGNAHLNNLENLQENGDIGKIYVVDIDEGKLPTNKECVSKNYTNLETALNESNPDIVFVCSNTEAHDKNIETVIKNGQNPGLFIEKPIADGLERAVNLENMLINNGYDAKGDGNGQALGFAYLIRFSDAVETAIDYVKKNDLQLNKVDIEWKKNRGQGRPSPGVHIDETTHAIDLALGYIIPALGYSYENVGVGAQVKRNSETIAQGLESMINDVDQQKLYANNPNRLDPTSQINYGLEIYSDNGKIEVKGFSSFVEGPMNRRVTLECENSEGNAYIIEIGFDRDKADELIVNGKTIARYEGQNRVLREWEAFLDLYKHGKQDLRLANLGSAVYDAAITGKFEQAASTKKIA